MAEANAYPKRKTKSKPSAAGSIWKRRSKGAERMVLSIPREIESAGAKRTLLRRCGGLEGIRTLDPHNANVVRSQLRYEPKY